MKISLILFFLFLNPSLYSQVFNYLPASVSDHQIITYSEFTLSYNEDHEQAEWVAYELTEDEVDLNLERCNCFAKDNNVTTGSAVDNDYKSTGLDRGHLSPSADNKASELANRESFLFSNMSPQLPGFNRGIWEQLEEWVRSQARMQTKIYVVTGPVFVNNLGRIGTDSVTIPGYYYKALLRFDGTTAKTIAFLLPQVGATGEIKDYIVTVNTIESLTGLDFYPELATNVENTVESQFEPGKWGLGN